jgi:hypothetical protein
MPPGQSSRILNIVIMRSILEQIRVGQSLSNDATRLAPSKSRGMRFVVFDPMCNFAGGKADDGFLFFQAQTVPWP